MPGPWGKAVPFQLAYSALLGINISNRALGDVLPQTVYSKVIVA